VSTARRWTLPALLLAAWALLTATTTAQAQGASVCPPLAVNLQRVHNGLWLRPAQPGAASGWTEPTLIWVDARTLWIADPGPHRCAGLALRRALQARWPGRAQQLINSHAHPDNVLANSAWPAGTPIYALAGVRQQMQQRCPTCLQHLRDVLGPQWMRDTRIVLPNRVLEPGQWLTLGGARWQVQAHQHAHTEADLSLWQPDSGDWFPGGLLAWDGVPDLSRGDLAGWQAALRWPDVDGSAASTLPLRVLGATTSAQGQARLQATRVYLDALAEHLRQADAQGADLQQVLNGPDVLPPDARNNPALQTRHQRNLQRAWRQFEDAALGAPPPNVPN